MGTDFTYKVTNWPEYNRNLIKRGNITIWFDESCVAKWNPEAVPIRSRGKPIQYSDFAIECALTLRSLYRLPLRATQGFLEGLKKLLNLNIYIPNYTTLSRRAKTLEIDLCVSNPNEKIDLIIDSTGLKVCGEGEWKTRIHGKGKRRTWRKLHIAIDPDSYQTVSMELTEGNVHDSKPFPTLIKPHKHIKNIYADGAYDYPSCFNAIKKNSTPFIAIRSSSLDLNDPSPGIQKRNELVREMFNYYGKKLWKKRSGYHKRSLVETQISRYKTIFGGHLQSRKTSNQITETRLKISILNRMTNIGMPSSIKK